MRLDRFLTRECRCSTQQARLWISQGDVLLDEQVTFDKAQQIKRFTRVQCRGEILQNNTAYYLMFNKPTGVVSATRDAQHKTVIDCINEPYAHELHIAGRLDATSTGLLLLTNDGQWSKSLMSPDKKVSKVYRVDTEHEIAPETVQHFAKGIYFTPENAFTRPAKLEIISSHTARLTLVEGRYHQVRRMFARVGNRVVKLHREQIGHLILCENDLSAGAYQSINPDSVYQPQCR